MKKVINFLVLLCPYFPSFSQSAPTDRQQIEAIIQVYFDGWATGDSAKLSKAMHSSSQLKFFRDGNLAVLAKAEYVGLYKKIHERDKSVTFHIVSMDVTNNIGSAKIEIRREADTFTDYFNLIKTSEGWSIADKVSTRTPMRTVELNAIRLEKETIITGLRRPWSMVFLSEEEALVSEKEGVLVKVNLKNAAIKKIHGFPSDTAASTGGGDNTGRFEVVLHPDYRNNHFIYLSYAAKGATGKTTKIIRAVLENDSLRAIKLLFVAEPFTEEKHHYGGGMVFGGDGKLYFTIGERLFTEKDEPEMPIAQNIEDKRGKIYRLNDDGTVPADNPDFGKKAAAGLYAMGIRAAQGLTRQPVTNSIWFTEHGTHQGDEINVLRAGANYGWPVKTTGKYRFTEYAPKVNPATTYTEPVWSWLQTVAPTGLHFYSGKEFLAWDKNLLVGGLAKGSLWRLVIDGETIKSVEELFTDDRLRIRKVIQSPMGKLYILTDEVNGRLIRIKNTAL